MRSTETDLVVRDGVEVERDVIRVSDLGRHRM